MPDENEKPQWAAPEPVFRSSGGRSLTEAADGGDQARTGSGDQRVPGTSMADNNTAESTKDANGESAGVKHGRGGRLQVSMTLVFLLFFGLLLLILIVGYYMWTHTGTNPVT